jgi:hypothetical protein
MSYLESGDLESVLDSYSEEVPGLSLYYPSRSQSLPKLRAFVEFATKRMRRKFQPGDYLPAPDRSKPVRKSLAAYLAVGIRPSCGFREAQ